MSVRVRRARERDLPAIARLDDALFPGEPLRDLEGDWWIAEAGGDVVGYASAREWVSSFPGERALVLTRAGVAPAWRRRGLGRRLIRVRVAHARRRGLPEVWTHTSYANPASSNNLIACGFRLWLPTHWRGSDPLAIEDETAFLYWRLSLR